MKRILAHKIIYLDKVYQMCVATIDRNNVVDISSFDKECHSTIFISGTIKLVPGTKSIEIIRIPD